MKTIEEIFNRFYDIHLKGVDIEGLLKDNITPPKQSEAIESLQSFSFNA